MKESSEEKIKQILKSKINIPSGYVDAINTAFIKKGKSNNFIKILKKGISNNYFCLYFLGKIQKLFRILKKTTLKTLKKSI